MRRFLAAMLTASLLLPALVTPVAACSFSLTLYEDPNYVSTDPLPRTVPCGDVPSMTGSFWWTSGDCDAPLVPHHTWNDCASSWKFVGSCHYGVALYPDANYTGSPVWSRWGSGNYAGGFMGYEDMMTSIDFRYRGTCPESAE